MPYKNKEDAKKYQRKWEVKNKERRREINKRAKDFQHDRYHAIKAQFSCEICGENTSVCLDFHHEEKKKMCVAQLIRYSLENLFKEIEKCRVLCANCHRKETFRGYSSNWESV